MVIQANKRIVLIISLISSFIMAFMGSSINIALPSIGREFNIDAVLLAWIATSFLLTMAIFLVPFGRIADIYGRKKVFAFGMLIYSAAALLCAFSQSETVLIIGRVIQGIGSAMFSATAIAILTSVFEVKERGRVIGITIGATYLGLSLGPVLGGLITEHLGWRFLFFLNIPFTLLVLLLTFWKIKGDWMEAKGEKFDWSGSAIYGFVLMALMAGFTFISGNILLGIGAIIASFVGLGLFIQYESKSPFPIININIFRHTPAVPLQRNTAGYTCQYPTKAGLPAYNRVFVFSNLAALINYCTTAGVGFLLSLYLQYIKGFSPDRAGLVMMAQPIVMTVFAPIAGRLSDRIEPRIVASTGMILTAVSLALFTFLGSDSSTLFVVIGQIILGIGFGLFSSPNTNAIMSSVDKKMYGIASASVSTMRIIGQMLSLAIATLLISIYVGHIKIQPDSHPAFLSSLRAAFIIFTILCVIGVFASLARGNMDRSQD